MMKFLLLGFSLTFAACGSDSKKDTGYESILRDHGSNYANGSDDTGFVVDEPDAHQDSCKWAEYDLCFETNESDNEAWCEAIEEAYGILTIYRSGEGCGTADVICDIPAGGDFTAAAVGYMDDIDMCTGAGGTVR